MLGVPQLFPWDRGGYITGRVSGEEHHNTWCGSHQHIGPDLRSNMSPAAMLATLLVLLVALATCGAGGGGGGGGHKKVIINVPYHIKNIHHTHTIFKIIKDEGHGGGDHYESFGGHDIGGGHDDFGSDGHW